jgi:hypothetical protein
MSSMTLQDVLEKLLELRRVVLQVTIGQTLTTVDPSLGS